MQSQNDVTVVFRIGILVLLVLSFIGAAGASAENVHSCGAIFIGETNVDVTGCVSGDTIGWWPTPSIKSSTSPSKIITGLDFQSFDANPEDFTGYTGLWYSWDPATGTVGHVAFHIMPSKST